MKSYWQNLWSLTYDTTTTSVDDDDDGDDDDDNDDDDDDNNNINNSYIALYTVKVYDPTALYIMKKQKEKLKQEKEKRYI